VNGTLEGRGPRRGDRAPAGLPRRAGKRSRVAKTLAAAVQSAVDAAGAPGPRGLERVLASIELLEAKGARRTGWRGWWRAGVEWVGDLFQRTPGPVRWSLAAQAALLVLVVGLTAGPGVRSPRAPYRTLADDGEQRVGQEALIHVVFTEDITSASSGHCSEGSTGGSSTGPRPSASTPSTSGRARPIEPCRSSRSCGATRRSGSPSPFRGARAMIRARLLRWRPRPHAQRGSLTLAWTSVSARLASGCGSPILHTPRRLPLGAASHLDPSHRPSGVLRQAPRGPS
jgi:hypothetical protein